MNSFLVIGGSGKTGRRVVGRLRATGHDARAAGRHSAECRFDWSDPGTYGPATAGVQGVFLTVAGQDPQNAQKVSAFLEVAAEAGVTRAVLLSARAVEFHPGGALATVEQAVIDAPLSHTILRPSWFAQNFTEAFLAPDADGVVRAPAGDGAEPFIDLEDLAAVGAAALMDDGPNGTVNLSGGESLSFREAVAALSAAADQPMRFVPADPDAYRTELATQMPAEYVAWRMAMFDAIREGRDAYVSDGVQAILGRPAVGFRAWAASAEPARARGVGAD